jgi:FkbM family methyltransferase
MSKKGFLQTILDLIPFAFRDKIKHLPLIKQIQALVIRKYMHQTEFIATISGGPARGLIFPVKLPQDKLMWIGTWELDFAKALRNSIKKGWVCYDIGGYKGYYSGIMALSGAKDVFVFEPTPSNKIKIQKLIELNPSLSIHLKEYAISDSYGEAMFKLMPEETMGKLNTSDFQQETQSLDEINVKTITLDKLIDDGLPEPDFIKIDVEGAEELVLKGSFDLLKRKSPMLMIEIHSRLIGQRCLNILQKYYRDIKVLETGLMPSMNEPEICHYIAHN